MRGETQAAPMLTSLINQWYNAVVRDCGLDPGTFQLVQGEMAVGTDSSFLWNIFDAVPPVSINHLYDPSQLNVFSADYGAVINALIPQVRGSSALAEALARDFEGPWSSYLSGAPSSSGGLRELVSEWASRQPRADATPAPVVPADDPVVKAVDLWYAAGGASAVKAYTGTITSLREALQKAPGATVSMDSAQESAGTSRSWAAGRCMAPPQSAPAHTAAADRLQVMVASGITVRAVYQHLAVFTARPLTEPNTDPDLGGYSPWFWGDALRVAYENNDFHVWKRSRPAWKDFFDAGAGVLQRFCHQLVVVDGCQIHITRPAGGEDGERAPLRADAVATSAPPYRAYLPFLPPRPVVSYVGPPRARLGASVAEDATDTEEVTTPVGRPFVLGVNVKPITAAWPPDAAAAQAPVVRVVAP